MRGSTAADCRAIAAPIDTPNAKRCRTFSPANSAFVMATVSYRSFHPYVAMAPPLSPCARESIATTLYPCRSRNSAGLITPVRLSETPWNSSTQSPLGVAARIFQPRSPTPSGACTSNLALLAFVSRRISAACSNRSGASLAGWRIPGAMIRPATAAIVADRATTIKIHRAVKT